MQFLVEIFEPENSNFRPCACCFLLRPHSCSLFLSLPLIPTLFPHPNRTLFFFPLEHIQRMSAPLVTDVSQATPARSLVGEQLAAQPQQSLQQQQQQPAAATDATMTAATSIPVTMPADKPAEQPVAVGGAAAAEPAKESGAAAAEGGEAAEAAPAAKGKGKAPASGKKKRSQFRCIKRQAAQEIAASSHRCVCCLSVVQRKRPCSARRRSA